MRAIPRVNPGIGRIERARKQTTVFEYGNIGPGSIFHFAGEASKEQGRILLLRIP